MKKYPVHIEKVSIVALFIDKEVGIFGLEGRSILGEMAFKHTTVAHFLIIVPICHPTPTEAQY